METLSTVKTLTATGGVVGLSGWGSRVLGPARSPLRRMLQTISTQSMHEAAALHHARNRNERVFPE